MKNTKPLGQKAYGSIAHLAARQMGDGDHHIEEGQGHGAVDEVEGVVYRVERNNTVDFLTKYVKPYKVDGKYLPERNDGITIWNWKWPKE